MFSNLIERCHIFLMSILLTIAFIISGCQASTVALEYGTYTELSLWDSLDQRPQPNKEHVKCIYLVTDQIVSNVDYVNQLSTEEFNKVISNTYTGLKFGSDFYYYKVPNSERPDDYYFDLLFVPLELSLRSEPTIVVRTNPSGLISDGQLYFVLATDGILLKNQNEMNGNDYGVQLNDCDELFNSNNES